MDSWDNRQRLASVWCESSNPPSLPVELGTDERTNGWTDEPTDGLSFAYDEPVAALTARGRGTSYKSPGTGNWNEGSSDRGSRQSMSKRQSVQEKVLSSTEQWRGRVLSSGEGTKALINAATISSCPLYTISCAVLLHLSKKECKKKRKKKKIRSMQKDTL